MRRNWQCTERKKLTISIIQPAQRSQQEGEQGGEMRVQLFTLYSADSPEWCWKSSHPPRSCHILYLHSGARLCRSQMCHRSQRTKAIPPNKLQQQTSFWRIRSTLKFKCNHFAPLGRREVGSDKSKDWGFGHQWRWKESVLVELLPSAAAPVTSQRPSHTHTLTHLSLRIIANFGGKETEVGEVDNLPQSGWCALQIYMLKSWPSGLQNVTLLGNKVVAV